MHFAQRKPFNTSILGRPPQACHRHALDANSFPTLMTQDLGRIGVPGSIIPARDPKQCVCEVYKQKVSRSRRIGVQRGDEGIGIVVTVAAVVVSE